MIEDIYNPVERFRTEFRNRFNDVANETFDNLLKLSGVDVSANREIVDKINASEQVVAELRDGISLLRFGQFILWLLVLACIFAAIHYYNEDNLHIAVTFALTAIFFLYVIFSTLGKRAWQVIEKLNKEKELKKENKSIAWKQMHPLHRLFDWDITVRMITKTVPRIHFDPYVTKGRLRELYEIFGMDSDYIADKSVLFAHSGEINGNPFVLAKVLYMEWGEETYEGKREVSYYGDDSNKTTETLYATIVKPKPEYFTETFLIYGCDAAPKLVFRRVCSGLANMEDRFWGKFLKNGTRRKLKRYSRKLGDESQYTMMANSDFETLFNTMDRNDEVEFRLLFTPIAQTQMLEILRNKDDGYGDDFNFDKLQKINVIKAKHLDEMKLDNNPNKYKYYSKCYSVDATRSEFIKYNQDYFKALYFAFAPLLAIPLYQQTRSCDNIYGVKEDRHSCFWEHVSLANFYGDKYFKHPECATRCILKTEEKQRGKLSTISVTAHGYKAIPRVETVCETARNGKKYGVKVCWKEYVAISRTSDMLIEEDEKGFEKCKMNAKERAEYIEKKESSMRGSIYRRSILSLKEMES